MQVEALNVGVLVANKNRVFRMGPVLERVMPASPAGIFFFTLNDVDYRCRSIDGVYYAGRGSWRVQSFHLPPVFYLRDVVPEHRRGQMVRLLNLIEERGARLVNSVVEFDKWDVHRALSKAGHLQQYLPETRLFKRQENELVKMFRKYGGVYLKGCRGRQGCQVMQVSRKPGFYEYRYYVNRLTVGRVKGTGELFKIIEHFFWDQDFIIQQPVDLITYRDRKVDLRVEMQRNGKGELEVVAVPVRVARRHAPITTHADCFRFEDFFAGTGYSQAELSALRGALGELLWKLFAYLENYYGSFGELGIDIGLDKTGRLWFIECNSQPAKVSLVNAYSAETGMRAFVNPLAYAVYLAGLPGSRAN